MRNETATLRRCTAVHEGVVAATSVVGGRRCVKAGGAGRPECRYLTCLFRQYDDVPITKNSLIKWNLLRRFQWIPGKRYVVWRLHELGRVSITKT